MALFSAKPELPGQWAALPGEPLEPDSATANLPEASPDPLGLLGVGAVESVAIPLGSVDDDVDRADDDAAGNTAP